MLDGVATIVGMSLDDLARFFADAPRQFAGSPLYARLCTVVAEDERLLAIAAEARAGQLPTNLLFAAVHYLLLRDPGHELAAWYPSVGGTAYRPVDARDPAATFTGFCLDRRTELAGLLRTRLVQTQVVKRAVMLRLGLVQVAARTDEPVTLIEVGSSAGVHLRFDEYGYEVAGRTWGRPGSPVTITTRWRGSAPPSDLDRIPAITDRVGVDLNPIDATDPDQRLWLRALVWPGNEAQARLHDAALRVVAWNPPRMVAGDAVEVLPELAAAIPHGAPVVVFHAATRMHVPAERREAFDAAIAAVGDDHRLFHLSFEVSRDVEPPALALRLREGAGVGRLLAVADGHVESITVPRL